MKNLSKFVIYPHNNNDETQPNLTPKDKLIYLAIRRYMDSKTLEAYPSYEKIKQDTGAVPRTVKSCVNNLIREGYIETRKDGRKIIYKFNNKKKFEPFSYLFLDRKDLSFTEKAYIVATQQYMFEQDDNTKTISYSNKELSNKINMPVSTISKCNRLLEGKGLLKDSDKLTKVFQARDLDLLFIEKFKDIDIKTEENTNNIKKIEKENIELKERISKLENILNIKNGTFIM